MGSQQLFAEDITTGGELPPFDFVVTRKLPIVYAAASRDFAPLHYDDERAAQSVWGRVILHGALKGAVLAGVASHLAGELGTVRYVMVTYRRPDFRGDPLRITGHITSITEEPGGCVAECELQLTNPDGEVTTTCRALVALPARGAPTEAPYAGPPADLWNPARSEYEGERDYPDLQTISSNVGRPWKPWISHVSATWIDLFARASFNNHPKHLTDWSRFPDLPPKMIAPPTFLVALDPFYRRMSDPLLDAPVSPVGAGNGWDDFEWYAPIRPGDIIAAHGRWIDTTEKRGRSGRLVFTPREILYQNQSGEIVARSRGAPVQIFPGDRSKT